MSGNYDNLSYDQIHNLCKDRGYHKKNAKVALKTRLGAMDAVDRQLIKKKENEADTSPSVFSKRDRSMAEQSSLEQNQQRVGGKRSRGDAPATTMEVDPAAAQAHAQWWSPDRNPKVEVSPIRCGRGC